MAFQVNAFIAGFDPENLSQISPTSPFLIEVDAYLSESHSFQARMPDHAVESGDAVNDHIILLRPIINIAGIITDTPLLKLNPNGGFVTPEEGRAIDRIKALLDLRERRQLFSVSTTLGVYRDYFFQEFTPSFTPDDGYSARFTATLKQLRLVTFRTGRRVLNQSQNISSRAADTNDVGKVTPKSLAIGLTGL